MRLIKCHIDGFGKLTNVDYDFDLAFNPFVEENGYGKTTLAAFIKAMLYGLENKRNDPNREKYTPWSRNLYGGSLDIEVDGENYRIIRKFLGTTSKDYFECIDLKTHQKTNRFSSNIGEEILKLNKASFSNTLFHPQNELDFVSTDNIDSLLSGIIDSEKDMDTYQKAMDVLEEYIKNNGDSSKKAFNFPDSLKSIQARVDELKENISINTACKEELIEYTTRKKEIEDSIDINDQNKEAVEKKIQKANRYNQLVDLKNKYDSLTMQYQNDLNSYKASKSSLLDINIDLKELEEYKALAYTYFQKEDNLISLKEDEIDYLNQHKIIPDMKLQLYKDQLDIYRNANQATLTSYQLHQLEQYELIYKHIDEKMILEQIAKVEKMDRIQRNRIPGIMILFSIIMIMTGIISLFILKKYYYLLISTIGFILLLSGIKMTRYKEVKRIKKELTDFISKFHQDYSDTFIAQNLSKILSDYHDYLFLKENAHKVFNEDSNQIENQMNEILEGYIDDIDPNHYYDYYLELLQTNQKLIQIQNKKSEYESMVEHLKELEDRLSSYISRYMDHDTQPYYKAIEIIKKNYENYCNCKNQLVKSKEALIDFEQNNDCSLLEDIGNEKIEIDKLYENLKEYDNANLILQLNTIDHEINEAQKQLDQLIKDEAELNLLEEKRDEVSEQVENVTKALSYLKNAKTSIDATYSQPVLNSFNHYYHLLTTIHNQSFNIDVNKKLKYKDIYDVNVLSSGLKDLVFICMRLALIDVLFKESKPFIIFDDPFVNLDDKKVELGLQLIKEISKEYQIIYFTCHHSRI